MKPREFDQMVENKCSELELRAESGQIATAKEADEAAVELAGESKLDPISEQFEALLSILTTRAGELFPGAWEDYPKTRFQG